MLYRILKPVVYIFFRVFYKCDYRGLENIPLDQPVVLAPNHVNAFVDAIVLALFYRKKIRSFARGDVFKGKTARVLLESLSISPMYRLQEGYGEIRKNDKTFEECRRRLADNEAILLFPEAICIQERKLRPLKKGLARIVFQTEETLDFKKDVLVVPVGLNYTAAYKFRSKLFIDIGRPVSVKEYEARFRADKVRTINEFTKEFEKKLAEHMVILDDTHHDPLLVCIEEMYLETYMRSKGRNVKSLEQQYGSTKELAEKINRCDERDPALVSALKERAVDYGRKIRAHGLRDHLLRPENVEKLNIWSFLGEGFVLFFGLPVYVAGWLLNYAPYYFAKDFTYKKIKNIEFYASIYQNLAMVLWGLFYAVQLLVIALLFRSWPLLAVYATAVPLLGFFCLWYYPVKEKIFGRLRLLRLTAKENAVVVRLVEERNAVLADVEKMMR